MKPGDLVLFNDRTLTPWSCWKLSDAQLAQLKETTRLAGTGEYHAAIPLEKFRWSLCEVIAIHESTASVHIYILNLKLYTHVYLDRVTALV